MALIQQSIVDQVEVTVSNVVQVRMANQIIDDSQTPPKVLASEYHRHCIAPGEDYSQEDPKVQGICSVVHTAQVIADYKAEQEANKPQVA